MESLGRSRHRATNSAKIVAALGDWVVPQCHTALVLLFGVCMILFLSKEDSQISMVVMTEMLD